MPSQKEQIKQLLESGRKVCAAELIETVNLIDYRARISSLRKEGLDIQSEPCRGRCGKNHTSPVNWYWIAKKEAKTPQEATQRLTEALQNLKPSWENAGNIKMIQRAIASDDLIFKNGVLKLIFN